MRLRRLAREAGRQEVVEGSCVAEEVDERSFAAEEVGEGSCATEEVFGC